MSAVDKDLPKTSLGANFNFGKKPEGCIDIAKTMKQMEGLGWSREKIAEEFDQSVVWVNEHLSLLHLDLMVQEMLNTHRIEKTDFSLRVGKLLSSCPKKLQRVFCKYILASGMDTPEARRYIRNERRPESSKVSPRNKYDQFRALSEKTEAGFDVWIDTPPSKLRAIFSTASIADKEQLRTKLKQLATHIDSLAELLVS